MLSKRDGFRQLFVTNVGDDEVVRTGRSRNGVKAVIVGHGSGARFFNVHRYADESFAVGRVFDVAANGQSRPGLTGGSERILVRLRP